MKILELLFWSLAFYGGYTILEDVWKWVDRKIDAWREGK